MSVLALTPPVSILCATEDNKQDYLRARSSSKFDVPVIPSHLVHDSPVSELVYGKVSLRACLETVCQSRCVVLPPLPFPASNLSPQPGACSFGRPRLHRRRRRPLRIP